MGDVKWISISTDIFNNEKMCAIESLPDGHTIELVWLKLLCLAGTCNESGFLMVNKDIPYTEEMMAKYFRMDVGIIQRALETFENLRMIEIVDNIYMVSNWSKYQNISELEHIKTLNKIRQQRYRDKKKLELKESNVTNDVTTDVTNNEFCSICNMYYLDVYKEIINYLNIKTNKDYRYTTKKYQRLIHARCEENYSIDDFKKVIDVKTDQWLKDDKMNRYLKPETLFAASHFDSYLNEYVEPPKSKYADALERMNKHMEERTKEIGDVDVGDFY